MAGKIARGDVRLYKFAAPDKQRPVLVLTRDSAITYLATVTVAPITSAIRGVRSEPAQRDYRVTGAVGKACGPIEFAADE